MEQIDKFHAISNSDLEKVDGGFVPAFIIMGGVVVSLVGGFAGGYALSRIFG